MILYEVTNGAGHIIAYFKTEVLARNYCQHNTYLKYEKICILYDAIDVFRDHKLITDLENEYIPCKECIHNECNYAEKRWECSKMRTWRYKSLKEMYNDCPLRKVGK